MKLPILKTGRKVTVTDPSSKHHAKIGKVVGYKNGLYNIRIEYPNQAFILQFSPNQIKPTTVEIDDVVLIRETRKVGRVVGYQNYDNVQRNIIQVEEPGNLSLHKRDEEVMVLYLGKGRQITKLVPIGTSIVVTSHESLNGCTGTVVSIERSASETVFICRVFDSIYNTTHQAVSLKRYQFEKRKRST